MRGSSHLPLVIHGFSRRVGGYLNSSFFTVLLRGRDNIVGTSDDGVMEAWFEEPGFADEAETDPYGNSSPQTVLEHLAGAAAVRAAAS